MTPYAFDYTRAASVDEALGLLAEHGDDAKLLAGGHSLIPAMKLRLAAPTLLIDITGIEDLTRITGENGAVRIGALATYRQVSEARVVHDHCLALAEGIEKIGDAQVRNKGTLAGSLAHADPAADLPALMLALDAVVETAGPDGTRSIPIDDFFVDFFTTALAPDEIITAARVPALAASTGAAYEKFANPASGYAVVGVCARVTVDDGTCTAARIGVTGAAPVPFRATGMEEALVGGPLDEETVAAAVADKIDAAGLLSDLGASAAYRAHLCEVLARRAVARAARQAGA